MFCPRCGRPVDNDAYTCPACGWYLRENPQDTYFFGDSQVRDPRYKERNGMAVVGFICAFFSPLLGWIFGGIGLSRAEKRNGKGEVLSVAALIISTIMFVINWNLFFG